MKLSFLRYSIYALSATLSVANTLSAMEEDRQNPVLARTSTIRPDRPKRKLSETKFDKTEVNQPSGSVKEISTNNKSSGVIKRTRSVRMEEPQENSQTKADSQTDSQGNDGFIRTRSEVIRHKAALLERANSLGKRSANQSQELTFSTASKTKSAKRKKRVSHAERLGVKCIENNQELKRMELEVKISELEESKNSRNISVVEINEIDQKLEALREKLQVVNETTPLSKPKRNTTRTKKLQPLPGSGWSSSDDLAESDALSVLKNGLREIRKDLNAIAIKIREESETVAVDIPEWARAKGAKSPYPQLFENLTEAIKMIKIKSLLEKPLDKYQHEGTTHLTIDRKKFERNLTVQKIVLINGIDSAIESLTDNQISLGEIPFKGTKSCLAVYNETKARLISLIDALEKS